MEAVASSMGQVVEAVGVEAGCSFDVMQAAVADFEERRSRIIPLVIPGVVGPCSHSEGGHRVRRFVLKGGMRKGSGKRLFVAGRIVRA